MWSNTAYCVKLSGEDLSRSSDKTESVGLRKCPYYGNLTKKVMSRYFTELAPYHGGKKQLAWVWYEEITSQSLYVYRHFAVPTRYDSKQHICIVLHNVCDTRL